jgi:hypothetical protein
MAERAEMLAEEFDSGAMSYRGGAGALWLFAELIRIAGSDPLKPMGSAAARPGWRRGDCLGGISVFDFRDSGS